MNKTGRVGEVPSLCRFFDMSIMKKLAIVLLSSMLFAACGPVPPQQVTVETQCRLTPVKIQGNNPLCWTFAMLAAVETEHFLQGDSVDLSVVPVMQALEDEHRDPHRQRGMGQTLLNIANRHGLYADLFSPDDFVTLCSVPDSAYGQFITLDLPDNWEGNRQLNVPLDTLFAVTLRAAASGRGICWEGDVSERGFSFRKGVADLVPPDGSTTDDHCMAIVGLAHDERGRNFFIMKNSWGTGNPYNGLMLMSFDYFKAKTILVALPRDVVYDFR